MDDRLRIVGRQHQLKWYQSESNLFPYMGEQQFA